MKDEDFFDNMDSFEDWLKENTGEKPIPEQLYSAYSKAPFEECIDCKKKLLVDDCIYQVQKVFKGKETIFEYAMCSDCDEKLMREYSQESLSALQEYVVENYLPSAELDHCHLCQQDSQQEYSLNSLCRGKNILGIILLCHKCMEAMESLLSQKTKDSMKDFIETKFPGIPAEFNPVPLGHV